MHSHHLFSHLTFPVSHPSKTAKKRCPLREGTSTQLHARTHLHFHTRALPPLLVELTETAKDLVSIGDDGPVQLPPSSSPFSNPFDSSDPSPLQLATSVLLTGSITVFLFRSLRRRVKRAKELRVRSSGVKSLKEDALDSLKAISSDSVEVGAPPSPIQALLGGIAAGVITVILYNFSTTIEAGLNRQAISDNFSVRQITITIRTIINGLCYLATFVFGINSIGLFLYSGQLAINSFMETSTGNEKSSNDTVQPGTTDSSNKTPTDNVEPNSEGRQRNVDVTKE